MQLLELIAIDYRLTVLLARPAWRMPQSCNFGWTMFFDSLRPISNNRIPLPELAALMRVQKFGDLSRGKWDQMIGNDWKVYEIGGRRIELLDFVWGFCKQLVTSARGPCSVGWSKPFMPRFNATEPHGFWGKSKMNQLFLLARWTIVEIHWYSHKAKPHKILLCYRQQHKLLEKKRSFSTLPCWSIWEQLSPVRKNACHMTTWCDLCVSKNMSNRWHTFAYIGSLCWIYAELCSFLAFLALLAFISRQLIGARGGQKAASLRHAEPAGSEQQKIS